MPAQVTGNILHQETTIVSVGHEYPLWNINIHTNNHVFLLLYMVLPLVYFIHVPEPITSVIFPVCI